MAGPSVLYQAGDHASRPANGSGCVLYSCTDHDLVYRDDGTSWTTFMTLVGGSGGDISTDTIWDAPGDLAVGSGANAAAKLPIGAAGGALSRVNGAVAWNSGTSFPTAATGDRYWRTDLGMEFFYDGTRWLCTCPHITPISSQDVVTPPAANHTFRASYPPAITATIRVERMIVSTFVVTTNSGSHYWTAALTSPSQSANTSANPADALRTISTSTAGNVTIANGWFQVDMTKTGSPGVAYLLPSVQWRYIGT